jgi:serine/threonine-protein kinase
MDNNSSNPDENTIFLTVPGKASHTIKPGDIMGNDYRLIELIGSGGMGFIYRCQHLIMGTDYALKILRPDQVNEKTWQRFEVEGKAIAKLDHPNIVKIYNIGV